MNWPQERLCHNENVSICRSAFKDLFRRFPVISRGLNCLTLLVLYTIKECCGKIDLFRVKNMVVHILLWWECCLVYQTEGLLHEGWSNFWLFWYQIKDSTLNRTNFTHFWRQKIGNLFNLEQVNFHVTLVNYYWGCNGCRISCHRLPIMITVSWLGINGYLRSMSEVRIPFPFRAVT